MASMATESIEDPSMSRTDCSFDAIESGNSTIGDFPWKILCIGGGASPVSLVEFTNKRRPRRHGGGLLLVSLVNGYNAILVRLSSGDYAGCVVGCRDLRELREREN
ncbi:Pathogenesis-related protein 5 [Striga hermonthica]|uniref:Pathogenesis-related protein 5 n=1 Tax=Striga hermonthica TaxID=68872 RepID=A0A9N7MH28_STRHE|nr:Pathogenesis-related protein 5 [Striga hermonthica]